MMRMNSRYRKILIGVAVAAVVVVLVAIYMGLHYQSMAAYNAKLAEADQLLEQQDYANAVLKYQEAIEEQPREEDGYVKLAEAYRESGHDDYALQIIERGLAKIPGSVRLTELKEEMTGVKSAVAVMLNQTLLDSLASLSYHDYSTQYGIESRRQMNDGSICVRVKGINADLIYSNTADQPNAVSGSTPAADSLPAYVMFDNIMSVLGGGSGASYSQLESLGLESLRIEKYQEYGTAVTFVKGLYSFVIQSDSEGNITDGSGNKVYIPGPDEKEGDTSVKGTVIDAVTGDGVANVTLTFRTSGGETVTAKTDRSGKFTANLDSGDCSVVCRADGYIEETKSIYVPSHSSNWSCELVISPDVDGGTARIVLTWGSTPEDLDSHLIGNGVHVSFMDMTSSKASLDLDDQDGYGPETTTINDLKGSYTFVVHDYQHTGRIAASGASVTVYLPGEDPQTISISGSGSSYTWVVFELNDGKLNVINRIKDYDLGGFDDYDAEFEEWE